MDELHDFFFCQVDLPINRGLLMLLKISLVTKGAIGRNISSILLKQCNYKV